MSRTDTASSRRDVLATTEVARSDRVCVDVRDTFARAHAGTHPESPLRADVAWSAVLDRLGWSIAYDITHDTHVSSAEVDLFKRIDQLLMARVRRRVEARERARRGEDPAAPHQSQAETSHSEGGTS